MRMHSFVEKWNTLVPPTAGILLESILDTRHATGDLRGDHLITLRVQSRLIVSISVSFFSAAAAGSTARLPPTATSAAVSMDASTAAGHWRHLPGDTRALDTTGTRGVILIAVRYGITRWISPISRTKNANHGIVGSELI